MTPDPAALTRERYARVQAAMARHEVGALLLATPHLAAFASGARRVQVGGSGGTTPWVAIAAGAPGPLVFTTDPDGAPPWLPRGSVLPLAWERGRQLARIAELIATTRGAVACDVFSPALRDLARGLGRPLVDAAPLLAEAVAPRTEREVTMIAGALAAARAGLRAALAALAPAATPAALIAHFARSMSAVGGGFPLSEGLCWRGGERLGATEPFRDGDVIALELGLHAGGHVGVAGDTAACGGGRDLSSERRAWFAALCAVAKRCRAGGTPAELCAAARAAGATQERLLAHGLGVGIETPFVDLDDERAEPLHAGTVLVLAPVVDGFRATRALLVTDASPRWLEAAP